MQRSLHMRPLWMLSIPVIIIILLSSAGCTSPTTQSASTDQTIDGITLPTTTGSPTPAEARQIAAAAYVFGYPLVFMDVWKDHQTAGVTTILNVLNKPHRFYLCKYSLPFFVQCASS